MTNLFDRDLKKHLRRKHDSTCSLWDWGNGEVSSVRKLHQTVVTEMLVVMPEWVILDMFQIAGICFSLCICDQIVRNMTTNFIHREN